MAIMKKAVPAKKAAPAKKAVAKKAITQKLIPIKKTSASSQSAKAHQKDLAKISANTAARNELSRKLKPGQKASMDKAGIAYGKADMRASKSFGLKSDQNKSRY